MEPIKVLVVDDSALMRRIIKDILDADARFTVVGTARDGIDALEKIQKLSPGLITLDVEMPRMDGLAAVKEIVRRFQLPVIMLSSLTQQGSRITIEALSLGAVDFIAKPGGLYDDAKPALEKELLAKAAAAAGIRVQLQPVRRQAQAAPIKKTDPRAARNVIAIGASTGGPRALECILLNLPSNLPAAVLVTQHMPPKFTRALAERLDKEAEICVKEAEHGEPVLTGCAYIAPGDYHMEVDENRCIRLTQDPPVEHVRPSVTAMMLSLPAVYGKNTVGVILTGMGKDGAAGMQVIKASGGSTIAQDQDTAVIFSMPKAAITAGAADRVLPLVKIAQALTEMHGRIADGNKPGI